MSEILFQTAAWAIPGGAGAVTLTPIATLTQGPGDTAGPITTIVVNGTAFPATFWQQGATAATYEVIIRKRT